jgi:GNAT superfamily N-acetyltransferase
MEYFEQKLNPVNYKFIQQLLNRTSGLNQDIKNIEKRYNTAFTGLKDLGFFAVTESDYPAAYYGAFPTRFIFNDKIIVGAQSGDTMTDPDHQKKGLFTKLATKTYEYCKEINVPFVFGFPNENSLPGFKNKLGWQFYGNMFEFSFQGSKIPLCELAFKYPFLKPLHRNLVRYRLSKFKQNQIQEVVKVFNMGTSVHMKIVRDESFFRYKENEDNYLIKINDFFILLKANTHLFIGDVAPFDETRTDDFLLVLKKLSKMVYSRKVVLFLNENHWLYSFMKNKIEPKVSLPIGFLNLSDVNFPFENIPFSMADYDTF